MCELEIVLLSQVIVTSTSQRHLHIPVLHLYPSVTSTSQFHLQRKMGWLTYYLLGSFTQHFCFQSHFVRSLQTSQKLATLLNCDEIASTPEARLQPTAPRMMQGYSPLC